MSATRFTALAALSLIAAAPAAAQPTTVVIDLWSFGFAPQPIRLAAGRPVTLTFVNRSGGGHDFTARRFFASSGMSAGAAPGGSIALAPRQSRSITLVPRAGTYPVHCSHFMHKQLGMRATIVVN